MDLPGAEKDLQHTIELEPKNVMAYSRLGNVRVLQHRPAEAERLYERALELDPLAATALQGLANLFISQGQSAKAVRRVQDQLAKVPADSNYHLLLAQIFLAIHQGAEGQAELRKVLEFDPGNVSALFALAQTEQEAGDLTRAASTYEQLVRQHPKEAQPCVALGILEERRGNWRRAEELYRKALDLEAGQPTAANNLSYLLLEHGGDSNYALSLAQIGRRGMPDSPGTADTLAWAYYQKGIYNSAIELLADAVKKAPENPTYHYHLGLAYQRVSKVSLARQSFQQALNIDPKSKHADEIRNALANLAAN
jgi:Flp pilus assembly protein TadD